MSELVAAHVFEGDGREGAQDTFDCCEEVTLSLREIFWSEFGLIVEEVDGALAITPEFDGLGAVATISL